MPFCMALAAAEAAAHSTYSLTQFSLRTTIPSIELQLSVFSLFLTVFFGRTRIHYSAYYSV